MRPTILAALLYLAGTAAAIAAPADLAPLREGDMTKLNLHDDARPVPDIAFQTPEGEAQLTDYAGQITVVNFWATWCPPCREEMPLIDALAGSRDDITVLAIGTARTRPEAAARFMKEIGAQNLAPLTDDNGLSRAFGILGLPVTIILDAEGREIARMQGEADWNGANAHKILDALVADAE